MNERTSEPDKAESAFGQHPEISRSAVVAGQVRLLYQQIPSAFLATLVNAAVLAYVVRGYVSPVVLWSWLTAVAVLTFSRFLLVITYRRKAPAVEESAVWARRFILGTVLSGCLWGAAGTVFFVESSPLHQLFLAFVLAGMGAGGMSTLSSYRGAYPAYLLPSLTPFAMETIAQGDEVHHAMGMMLLLFAVMMLIISERLRHMLTSSLQLSLRNADLVRELTDSWDRQKRINQELQAQMAEREHAERLLQDAYDKMEQRVRERTRELNLANKILHREKELFRVTIASIGDAVITTDDAGRIQFLNPVAERLTGCSAVDAVGLPLKEVFRTLDEASRLPVDDILQPPAEPASGHLRTPPLILVRQDGQELAIDHTIAPICEGSEIPIGTVLVFRDVSAQRKLAMELSYQASHDELTGLVNRREFEGRLARALATVEAANPHVLLYLDLDQFKVVNDQCGHTAGDELLRQIATLLQSAVRARDSVARLGGDEFGILLEHCRQDEAWRIAQNLRELVQNFRFAWEDKRFAIGITAGLFAIVEKGETLSSALGAADSACYAAKSAGRNRVHVYRPDDRDLMERKGDMRWLPRIQHALAENRFCLYVQPIVPFASNTGKGAYDEVLLRMRDEKGSLILPGAFLPPAERYQQIVAIDRWVVSQVLSILSDNPIKLDNNGFAVNLSSQALADDNFLDFVVNGIAKNGVSPSSICFEIHENAAISDFRRVSQFVNVLRELGCRFALDDFGAGFSSFAYLKMLSVDYLKIDGQLVKDMLNSAVDQSMVESIHNIGHVMGLETVAEWVETAELSRELEAIGIDYGQGFELGRPQPISNFAATAKVH